MESRDLWTRLAIGGTFFALMASGLQAQPCGEWTPGPGQSAAGTNGQVLCAAEWDPDGAGPELPVLVVGGSFTVAGDVGARRVAVLAGDRWQALGRGIDQLNSAGDVGQVDQREVTSLVVHQGVLYAGWSIASVPSAAYSRVGGVSRWNGSSWELLASADFPVRALASHDGSLFVGGEFQSIGPLSSPSIMGCARWDGAQWFSEPMGLPIRMLATFGTELAAYASSPSNAPIPTHRVWRWTTSGWQNLGPNLPGGGNVNGRVRAITEFQGNLLAIGDFSTIGGAISVDGVAEWGGIAWQARSLAVSGDRIIAAASTQSSVFYVDSAGAMRSWNGVTDVPIPGAAMAGCRAVLGIGSDVYVAGSGGAVAGELWPGRATVLVRKGATWSIPSQGWTQPIAALALHGGALVAGGVSCVVNGALVEGVAEYTASQWRMMGTNGSGSQAVVNALHSSGGRLFVGGEFESIGGVSSPGVIEWTDTGWVQIGGGLPGPSVSVFAVAVFQGGVCVGGSFAGTPASSISHLARWDGQSWSGIGPAPNGAVRELAVHGGKLYAAGWFSEIGGAACNGFAMWDGSQWEAIQIDGPIRDMMSTGDELIVLGNFSVIGGVPASRVARLASGQWQSLGTGVDGGVLAALDGQVVVLRSGNPGEVASAWNGVTWRSLPALVIPGPAGVFAAATLGRSLVVAGDFTRVQDPVTTHLAVWRNHPADVASEAPAAFDAGPDGFLTGVDFEVFVQAFFAETSWPRTANLIADCADEVGNSKPDGFLTGVDFDLFVQLFFAGC